MTSFLWILQGALALGFGASAFMKGTWDRERLARSGQTGVQGLPMPVIRFIAVVELFGAIGLVVPWATGIAMVLTPLAAVGLAIVMLLAAGVHTILREPRAIAITVVICAACLAVACGRGLEIRLLI